jgi:protocatechuate 3,4-dioxygenase beta subunit
MMDRRKLLGLFGATGLDMVSGYSLGKANEKEAGRKMFSCVPTPQQTEGPYFVDEHLRRADIRSDPSNGLVKEGVLLALNMRIFSVDKMGCSPIAGAIVDIWQCDAQGLYSDVVDSHFNTVGKKFLRGYQVTNTDGCVQFLTIYPGWYPGRTVHIHFKIRTDPKTARAYEFTSQLYFDDSLTDRVHEHPAYTAGGQKGSRLSRTKNEEDGIFRKGGRQLILELAKTDHGYAGSFDVGLEMGEA